MYSVGKVTDVYKLIKVCLCLGVGLLFCLEGRLGKYYVELCECCI